MPFQVGIAQPPGQRPTQARRGETPLVLTHAAAGNLHTGGNLAGRQPGLIPQAQHFSNLTHGQTLHLDPLRSGKGANVRELCPASPTAFRGGRMAVESVAESAWNIHAILACGLQ